MPALLNLEHQALVRAWIRGVPLAALDIDVTHATLATLTQCRISLYLKACRLNYPQSERWLQRRPNQDWERSTLQQFTSLLRAADLDPLPEHALCLWVAPEPAACLIAAQLTTLSDLIKAYQHAGKAWWKTIPGLGRVSAQRVERMLTLHFPDRLEKLPKQDLVLFETGVVTMERLVIPATLDGSQGSNRAPVTPFIPMTHDLAAIQAWLALLDNPSHTQRSYRREAERLLLWAIMVKHQALSSLNAVDFADYRRFLQDPQPAKLWVGPPQPKHHPQWKPFTGPLSRRSVKHAETLLNGLFTFLVQQRYLQHNPLSALPKLKVAEGQIVIDVHRAFTPTQWTLISDAAERLISDSTGLIRRKWLRTRLILHLGYATGLRLHELTQATVADLVTVTRSEQTQYWLSVLGKGQKLRQVPLSPAVVVFLNQAYRELTGRVLNRQDSNYPLFPDLHQSDKAVTPMAIHKVMKDFFQRAAEPLLTDNPEAAAHIGRASTHWLRHTHGTMAVDSAIPLTMIRDNLGHSSIAITSHYLHSDADARYDAFNHFAEPPALTNKA
jgi:site-specific recombinase XerD